MEVVFVCIGVGYVIVINIIGIYAMYNDKNKARQKKRRMREKTLFTIAWIGGAVGILIGSKRYRHKTKHSSFIYGVPLIILLHMSIIGVICYYFQDDFFG